MGRLRDVSKEKSIYIDSSIFVYHHSSHPAYGESCSIFLKRIEKGEIKGFLSSLVLEETSYVLLKLKASEILRTDKYSAIMRELKCSYEIFDKCMEVMKVHLEYVYALESEGHIVISKEYPSMKEIFEVCKKWHILVRDAIHLHSLVSFNLKDIATNDSDFERVDFLKVWKP